MLLLVFACLVVVLKGDKAAFDCPMRQMALNYAAYIQPNLSVDQLQEIADALNGGKSAYNCSVSTDKIDTKYMKDRNEHRTPKDWSLDGLDIPGVYIYIDPINGDDSNIGNKAHPFKTIKTGIIKSRSYGIDTMKYIILREGRHYLTETIELRYEDSNLAIRNYDNELAEVSGAVELKCDWKLYKNTTDSFGIYTCTDNNVKNEITGLRVDGNRGIRARYPNANPETDGFGSNLEAKSWMSPAPPYLPDSEYNPDSPKRNESVPEYFWYYNLGMGGICDNFTPSAGYWCSGNTQGGGAFTYRVPYGMTFNKSILPHSPYSDASHAVIQAWRPSHWMFDVGTFNDTTFTFSKGGFQGARGNNNGAEFYIENVFEELDIESEWFHNASTNMLYWYNNNTGLPNQTFEYTNLKVLFSYVGNMSHPVQNISLNGTTLRDTAYTYLDPHGMPSGGDWGLERTGAVYMDYVENVMISNNIFTRLDGNAISINRYARNVTIKSNEIVWTGDSAITLWGDTQGITFPDEDDPTEMGYDGTNGNQPRGVLVTNNYVHELGIWEKQSSFYFQAKSCENMISHNIFYNGPRAGINFNDGFGGNSVVTRNLLFDTCRESSDHGPFNSWDRQVYLTKVKSGGKEASVIKAFDYINYNFILANYGSSFAVDNDDGSAYYNTTHNFLVYSPTGLKSNNGGHSNFHSFNIYAYINNECKTTGGGVGQLEGFNDMFFNNTVVLNKDNLDNCLMDCSTSNKNTLPILYNNVIRTPSGDSNKTGNCNMNEASFQDTYKNDLGTIILGYNDTQILNQAYHLLFT